MGCFFLKKKNSWSEFHFLHCCGSGNSRTCVHYCPFFSPKERCKSFFTTCASVPVRDWASRPSLTLDEICVFRKPSETRLEPVGTRPEPGGIRRNWPDSDGTCHHQGAEQSPSARTRHRYLCFRSLTSETSIQQLAEVLSKKCVLGTRASRPAGLPFTPPDSTLLRVPPCPGQSPVPSRFRPGSARFRFVAVYQGGRIARTSDLSPQQVEVIAHDSNASRKCFQSDVDLLSQSTPMRGPYPYKSAVMAHVVDSVNRWRTEGQDQMLLLL